MIPVRHTLRWMAVLVALVALPGWADDEELCEPFRDGVVDETLVSKMLEAADKGHLYRIRKDTSRVGFCVESEFKEVVGTFRDVKGGLAFGTGDASNGQTMVVVQTASVETDHAVIDPLIKGKQFFDVGKFPEILFVSSGFRWVDGDSALLTGNLTLHGVTRPVVFNVELTNTGDKVPGPQESVLFKATTAIKRSEFGMDTLSSVISDTVRLCLSVEAVRYRG